MVKPWISYPSAPLRKSPSLFRMTVCTVSLRLGRAGALRASEFALRAARYDITRIIDHFWYEISIIIYYKRRVTRSVHRNTFSKYIIHVDGVAVTLWLEFTVAFGNHDFKNSRPWISFKETDGRVNQRMHAQQRVFSPVSLLFVFVMFFRDVFCIGTLAHTPRVFHRVSSLESAGKVFERLQSHKVRSYILGTTFFLLEPLGGI